MNTYTVESDIGKSLLLHQRINHIIKGERKSILKREILTKFQKSVIICQYKKGEIGDD